MKVTCTGRRVTLKPSFIENAEKRLAKLDKFFPDEAQAQVTVTVEKSGQTVEIMLRSKDLAMRAEKTDERMEDALADAVDLLTRRVVKYRKRLGTKLTAAAAEIPATEPEESMDIVREKHFALKPCSTRAPKGRLPLRSRPTPQPCNKTSSTANEIQGKDQSRAAALIHSDV